MIVAIVSLVMSAGSFAEELVTWQLATASPAQYQFDTSAVAGLESRKITSEFRIRGFEVASNVYVGQTKVADSWGLGVVYERGDTYFGMNHRGIQVMKRF